MKLRIKGDTLRLRLSRAEAEIFARDGSVSDAIHFPGGGRLVYALGRTNGAAAAVRFDGAAVRVELPAADAAAWLATDEGFQAALPLDSGQTLNILIEKDLQCLHRREGEDESDLYPNPGRR